MDKQEGIEFIEKALLDNLKIKDKHIRRNVTTELQEDYGISCTTSYEWYREAYQNFRTDKVETNGGYKAIHPSVLLRDAEDIMLSISSTEEPERYMQAQKHYSNLLGKFKHLIMFRSNETH
tara:strand:- start:2 stop:364 length:363 start_codon:yes stop_codon:yes gene_type:complete